MPGSPRFLHVPANISFLYLKYHPFLGDTDDTLQFERKGIRVSRYSIMRVDGDGIVVTDTESSLNALVDDYGEIYYFMSINGNGVKLKCLGEGSGRFMEIQIEDILKLREQAKFARKVLR